MAKRFSLREFQQNILDRIQQKDEAGDRITTLGIQIGLDNWVAEMHDIEAVLTLPAVTPVPLTQSWYCGVANVRGNLYSIVDLAEFMGLGETARMGQCRVLLVGRKFAVNSGLLVARVLGLRDARGWQTEVIDGESCYRDEQGQLWRKLGIGKLLQQPNFLQIGV